MSTVLETLVTTLVSGALTAGGAYFAVIWRLSHRLIVLETKIVQLDKTDDELKRTDARLEVEQQALRESVKTEFSDLKDGIYTQISDLFKELVNRLDSRSAKIAENLVEYRAACVERSNQHVGRQSFEHYTQEEERRWQEFYKAVGKLEVVIDRAFRGSGYPPSNPSPATLPRTKT